MIIDDIYSEITCVYFQTSWLWWNGRKPFGFYQIRSVIFLCISRFDRALLLVYWTKIHQIPHPGDQLLICSKSDRKGHGAIDSYLWKTWRRLKKVCLIYIYRYAKHSLWVIMSEPLFTARGIEITNILTFTVLVLCIYGIPAWSSGRCLSLPWIYSKPNSIFGIFSNRRRLAITLRAKH